MIFVARENRNIKFAFVVAGGDGGLREINPQKNRNSAYKNYPSVCTHRGIAQLVEQLSYIQRVTSSILVAPICTVGVKK